MLWRIAGERTSCSWGKNHAYPMSRRTPGSGFHVMRVSDSTPRSVSSLSAIAPIP